jgi:phospholipid/cholesterol/gamma-HCH transport system substrate-binding protein
MRFSSSFKVGILTLTALIILIFGILWIKGRALSTGERLTVDFKDVNGMRPGSAVQMMGFRVGQVEEIIPTINDENSKVRVKFVITEPDITIPAASSISIQQSGIIGEQFLEITPPRIKTIYLPITKNSKYLHVNDAIEMKLSDKLHDAGKIKKIEIIETKTLPLNAREEIKTEFAYKVGYIITLPGLIPPDRLVGEIKTTENNTKLFIKPANNRDLVFPQTDSKYTVIEPLRLADFMELQYRAAASLTETNERLSTFMSDDIISDLKSIVGNVDLLTIKANSTLDKAQLLIDAAKEDLNTLVNTTDNVSQKVIILTDSLNEILSDKDFKKTLMDTTQSVNRLSGNINNLLEDKNTKLIMENLQVASKNISEISVTVNDMTKDQALRTQINTTVTKFNLALDNLSATLETVNSLTSEEEAKIKKTIDDAAQTSQNLRKFSDKLNKRFLLFRLLF